MKPLDRFSDVHLPDRLHNQLNRLVQFANDNTTEQQTHLTNHDQQIQTLQTQLSSALAQIKALQDQLQQ